MRMACFFFGCGSQRYSLTVLLIIDFRESGRWLSLSVVACGLAVLVNRKVDKDAHSFTWIQRLITITRGGATKIRYIFSFLVAARLLLLALTDCQLDCWSSYPVTHSSEIV